VEDWTSSRLSTVLSFSCFLATVGVDRGPRKLLPPKFLAYLVILCFDRQCPEQNTVARLKSKYLASRKNLACTACNYLQLLLVTTFIHTAASFSRPAMSSVSRFSHSLHFPIWCSIFPLEKSSQQRKTARHCRTPMKSSFAILILRSKNITVLLLYR